MIRTLALVQKAPGVAPNQRFRLEQWQPHLLRSHGIEVDIAPFESPALSRVLYRQGRVAQKAVLLLRDVIRRRSALSAARAYDAVIILREAAVIGPPLYEWLLARSGVPIIYDFDDAIWTRPTPSNVAANDAFRVLKFHGKTATVCRLADVVTVGNEYLAAWARQHNSRVNLVPTSIDLPDYPVQPALRPDEVFTIVWSGSFSTLPHLELARPAIEALGKRRSVRLHVIADRPMARPFAGVEYLYTPWRRGEEAVAIGNSHVGIMPLPDDEFARGKCALKALQYMGSGRTVVASPVGVNADVIRHGENGFLASSTEEWVEVLDRLADAPDLRDRVALAGRRTVEERFSAERSAAGFAEAIRAAIDAKRAHRPSSAVQPSTSVPVTKSVASTLPQSR